MELAACEYVKAHQFVRVYTVFWGKMYTGLENVKPQYCFIVEESEC